GNPLANGGDGVGKTALFTALNTSTIVINDVLQDPALNAGGGVQYAGSQGTIKVNAGNLYTGTTVMNGNSTVQLNHDPTATSGPPARSCRSVPPPHRPPGRSPPPTHRPPPWPAPGRWSSTTRFSPAPARSTRSTSPAPAASTSTTPPTPTTAAPPSAAPARSS